MLISLLLACTLGTAQAAPPSASLSGPDGTLVWTIAESGGEVRVIGKSPKWTIDHRASPSLAPKSTTRTNPDGSVVTVEWAADKVTVTLPKGKVVTHKDPNIWDGDTLEVRLGDRVRAGKPMNLKFQAIDTGSGKAYGFDVEDKGAASCASGPCQHVHVSLSGWLKYVGPSFDYWFAKDGKLVKFEGPAGKFEGS